MTKQYLARKEFLLYERVRDLRGVISRHASNETHCRCAITGFTLYALATAAMTFYSVLQERTGNSAFFGINTLAFAIFATVYTRCPERLYSLNIRKELKEIRETPEYENLVSKLRHIHEQRHQNTTTA